MATQAFTALTPKEETESMYPSYNGSGVIVAILDTGIDPAAAGLKECPDGRPKVVDLVDASGSGDVNTREAVEAMKEADGTAYVIGLTGRKLLLNPTWKNPSGRWRIGVKRGYEIFPKPLQRRISSERASAYEKEVSKLLTAALRESVGAAGEKAAELEKRVALLKGIASSIEDPGPIWDVVAWNEAAEGDVAQWKAAVDTQENGDFRGVEGLEDFKKSRRYGVVDEASMLSYAINIYDNGDVVSIVTDAGAHGTHVAGIVGAYHGDGASGNGVAPGVQLVGIRIGDSRIGSMETGTGLTRALRAVLDSGAHVINMSYGEPSGRGFFGRFLELSAHLVREHNVIFVSSAGNAGPALSTVGAPGGVNPYVIGVGAAVTQAMMTDQYSLRRFYGARGQDRGVPVETAEEGVESDALTESAKHAGGMEAKSPELADTTHVTRLHDRAEDTNYTWSSRGPCMDGALGVSICAPGGAITSVPAWCLQKNQLMNGTSMSSPNAAGCIALLLSGLLQEHIPYTARMVRRAVENSAAPLSCELLGSGYGMIQVVKAYEHLLLQHKLQASVPFLEVTVANGGAGAGEPKDRGIYMREHAQSCFAEDFSITISPIWQENTRNEAKFDFQLSLDLVSTDASFISCPERVLVMNGGRSFTAHVDPRGLTDGCVHFAELHAYEHHAPEAIARALGEGSSTGQQQALWRALGPIARIPVTVVKPEIPTKTPTGTTFAFSMDGAPELPLSPGRIHRRFIAVPEGARWAQVVVHRVDGGDTVPFEKTTSSIMPALQDRSSRTIVVHAMQIQRHLSPKNTAAEEYLYLRSNEKDGLSFKVFGGSTLEVVIAQFWSSLGDCAVHVDVTFHGISLLPGVLAAATSDAVIPITVLPQLHDVWIRPIIKLTSILSTIEPTTQIPQLTGFPLSTVVALSSRDVLVNQKQQYAIVFGYKVSLEDKYSNVTFSIPKIHNVLYEASYDSQLLLVLDENNKLVGTSDAFAEEMTLKKGDYFVYCQVRHEDPGKLEALKSANMQLSVNKPLPKASFVTLKCSASLADAVAETGMGRKRCKLGVRTNLFVPLPSAAALPKAAKVGDRLIGFALFEDYNNPTMSSSLPSATKVEEHVGHSVGREPAGFRVELCVTSTAPPPASKASGPKESKDSNPITAATREMMIKLIKEAQPFAEASTAADVTSSTSKHGLLQLVAGDGNLFQTLCANALIAFPKDLRVLNARLVTLDEAVVGSNGHKLFATTKRGGSAAEGAQSPAVMASRFDAVVAAADDIISAIDEDKLAAYWGVNHDDVSSLTGDKAKLHTAMTEARQFLIDALWRKFRILAVATQMAVEDSDFASAVAAQDNTAKQVMEALERWIKATDNAYLLLSIEKSLRNNQIAHAAETVAKVIGLSKSEQEKTMPIKSAFALLGNLYAKLGWNAVNKRLEQVRVASGIPLSSVML